MEISEATENPRELAEGESEAVTIAFSDDSADVCGVARIGRAISGGVERTSGLAVLFSNGEPVAVRAEAGEPDLEAEVWAHAAIAGVETELIEPLNRWTVTFANEDGRHGFDLELESHSEPATMSRHSPVGKLGGMQGYDQLVTVSGSVTLAGRDVAFSGRGQRGHSWGKPDWSKLSASRTISVWLDNGDGVGITTVRPFAADAHSDDAVHALLLPTAASGKAEPQPLTIADPRISTTYDGHGRQLSGGLELYVHEDDEVPLRLSGDAACGTTLELGQLRLQCAFFRWQSDLGAGVGRYDSLTSA